MLSHLKRFTIATSACFTLLATTATAAQEQQQQSTGSDINQYRAAAEHSERYQGQTHFPYTLLLDYQHFDLLEQGILWEAEKPELWVTAEGNLPTTITLYQTVNVFGERSPLTIHYNDYEPSHRFSFTLPNGPRAYGPQQMTLVVRPSNEDLLLSRWYQHRFMRIRHPRGWQMQMPESRFALTLDTPAEEPIRLAKALGINTILLTQPPDDNISALLKAHHLQLPENSMHAQSPIITLSTPQQANPSPTLSPAPKQDQNPNQDQDQAIYQRDWTTETHYLRSLLKAWQSAQGLIDVRYGETSPLSGTPPRPDNLAAVLSQFAWFVEGKKLLKQQPLNDNVTAWYFQEGSRRVIIIDISGNSPWVLPNLRKTEFQDIWGNQLHSGHQATNTLIYAWTFLQWPELEAALQ